MGEFQTFINEIQFTKKTDYVKIGSKHSEVFKALYNVKNYKQVSVFTVSEKIYYCILLFNNDNQLEPHFGVFNEELFKELKDAVMTKNLVKQKELFGNRDLTIKDGITNTKSDFVTILSYVFSILFDYLETKPYIDIKIMGTTSKYAIYKKLVRSNVTQYPYIIKEEDVDTFYLDGNGNKVPAKATILKYALA